jgi:Ca2+-binding EF-hand superfamily protein/tetratricopeptide (TPR) repeat protein
MLRRALAAIGVHSPTLAEQIDECFHVLDPEATGTISFSELHGELRRVRKLLTPASGYGPGGPMKRAGSAPPGGRSGPHGAAAGLRHEDGTPFSAVELERAAAQYRRQGELGQALRALEAALAIHARVHGERSEVAVECSRQVADVCNSLGMQMLQRDDFVGCHALLRRAQARGQGDRAMFAITLNNLACYHRRRGHLKVALAHLSKAVDIEAHCDGAHKPADTHLNMCAVHSELGNHHEAMHHAKVALRLLRDELGMPPPSMASPNSPGALLRPGAFLAGGGPSSAAGLLTGGGPHGGMHPAYGEIGGGSMGGGQQQQGQQYAERPPPSAERMAVLAIAHHNLAVEQEALRLPDEASRSFGEAAAIASQQLGDDHPVAAALRQTHEANMMQRERRAMAEHNAMMAAKRGSMRSVEDRRAAELRKQASVQRHIEQTRLLRRDGVKTRRFKPHEARDPIAIPKILSSVNEDGDIAAALREWLKKNASKVMNMFKQWDFDGSGTVDKSEFRKAMKAMGLNAPVSHVDALFDEFDNDGGGLIEFKELNHCLRQGSAVAMTKAVVQSNMATREGMKKRPDSAGPMASSPKPKTSARPSSAAPVRLGDGRDDGFAMAGEQPASNADRPTGGGSGGGSPVGGGGGGGGEKPEEDDVANAEEEEAFDVGMRQNAMEFDAADVDRDTKLSFEEFGAMIREREEGEHSEEELRVRFNSIDENNNNRIDLDEFIRFSLRDALQRSSARVIDLFRDWDEDESGSVDIKEFRKAIVALGFEAPREEIEAVFKQLDKDGSGMLEYKELNKMLRSGAGSTLDPALMPGAMGEISAKGQNKHALRRGKMSGKKGGVLATSVKLEPGANGQSVVDQLREILNKNSVRVIDLFRSWDDDGNGKINAKEFRQAICGLGYSAPREDCNKVFGLFDVDKSGEIDYNELNRALRRGAELAPELQAGAVAIELTAKNKSSREGTPIKSEGSKKGGFTASLAANMNVKQDSMKSVVGAPA